MEEHIATMLGRDPDTFVTFGAASFPAWSATNGCIVDLTLADPSEPGVAVFLPERLAWLGVPDDVILAAAGSYPEPGFVAVKA